MIRQDVTSAVTSAKNAVVKTSTNFRNDWQSGINQLKESGTVGKRFAAYSEGVVNNLDNIAVGTIQLARDPLGTINESVNNFIADPVRNNPLAAVGQYYKDIAKASYAGDWDTVANKLGSGTATVAVMGITGTLAEGGAGKIFPKGINIDKTINWSVLEKYKYAGTGGYEIGLSTVTVPIKASISASAVSTASGVGAAAIAGQGIYYSSNGSNGSNNTVKVDEYGKLKNDKSTPGQAHHLNQNAAYKDVIPPEKGISVKLEGNAFTQPETPHYMIYDLLEEFWNQFRRGGDRYGELPTNIEYSKAVLDSLKKIGYSKQEALEITRQSIRQRVEYGLSGGDLVPRIPVRIYQTK